MRNYVSGAVNMVPVEVQNADDAIKDAKIFGNLHGDSGTNLILLSDDDTGFMPYAIDNFSKECFGVGPNGEIIATHDDILSYRYAAEHEMQDILVDSAVGIGANEAITAFDKDDDQSLSKPQGWLKWLSLACLMQEVQMIPASFLVLFLMK